MTTAELHKILDDENRKLSLDELKFFKKIKIILTEFFQTLFFYVKIVV